MVEYVQTSTPQSKKRIIAWGGHCYYDWSDLIDLYVNQKKPVTLIALLKGCKPSTVCQKLEGFGVKRRGFSEAARLHNGNLSGFNLSKKERNRKYYKRHRDEFLRRCKLYSFNNAEKIAHNRHLYWLKNKERIKAYDLKRYHKLQDECGGHGDPRNFYPGYRLIKYLETAPIVTVEG